MHQGRKRMMRVAATSECESPGGAQGELEGGAAAGLWRSIALAACACACACATGLDGLDGTDGSVSVSFVVLLRLVNSRYMQNE